MCADRTVVCKYDVRFVVFLRMSFFFELDRRGRTGGLSSGWGPL